MIKGITPKFHMLVFVLINSIILNLLMCLDPKINTFGACHYASATEAEKSEWSKLTPHVSTNWRPSRSNSIPIVVCSCSICLLLEKRVDFPHLHTPFSPSLISLMVSVDHAYLSTCCHWTRRVIYIAWLRYKQNRSWEMYSPVRRNTRNNSTENCLRQIESACCVSLFLVFRRISE